MYVYVYACECVCACVQNYIKHCKSKKYGYIGNIGNALENTLSHTYTYTYTLKHAYTYVFV